MVFSPISHVKGLYDTDRITDCCEGPENCENYRGTLNTTYKGRTCQKWNVIKPHKHNFNSKDYPEAGLEDNYCRNPSGTFSLWCYTTDTVMRWERCVVPICPGYKNMKKKVLDYDWDDTKDNV